VSSAWPCAIARAWYPVAHADELGVRPLARTLMDLPLVLFRSAGAAVALVDRCPHRNAPLSCGRIAAGRIACGYHGWQFDGTGRCVAVPGADTVPDVAVRRLPVREAAGLVWICSADAPAPFPTLPAELESESLDTFWWRLKPSRARVLDAIENLLDPAHPHFLHPYLVRRPAARRPVRVRFTSDDRGGEARYEEMQARLAWLPRLFEGRRTIVVGRYLAPATAQLSFENATGPTLTLTVVFTPEAEDRMRPFAHFATRRGLLPAWLKRLLLIGFHLPVLQQDRAALAAQARNIERFKGVDFHPGPLDLFGPLIWRLAHDRKAAPEERELQFWL
jgi:phenylpropionate dioxygenase-like ring-hydroxylating dioxygenase large terminal subunit